MKRLLSLFLITIMCISAISMLIPTAVAAESYDHEINADIAGYDTTPTATGVFVYPNESKDKRVIKADDYGFNHSRLMIFNADGILIEAGHDIYPNTSTVTGSPQLSVTVPSGGFLVAFQASASSELNACHSAAMEGAMLYNATMSITFEVHASYDKETNKLNVRYNDAEPPSKDAVKYLFVGNSSTYFNGVPIKYKAMCKAIGKEITVDYCTYGSAKLAEFADEKHVRGQALRKALNSKKYDYVVVQNMNGSTYEESKSALDIIEPLVKSNGAELLLYMRYCSLKDASLRKEGAQIHNDAYTRLAKDFNAKVSPVADAFIICNEKYPEINLHADDNAHHSAAGSYLIACTWLKAFTGQTPVGNGYTANLDEDTVKALQECAVIACEYGYDYDGSGDGFPTLPKEESKAESTVTEDNSDIEEEKSGIILWIVIGAIVAIIAIAAIAILLKSKK